MVCLWRLYPIETNFFISKFWTTLTALCSVKLKMLSAYHPQTDGLREHTNKTVNQSLCYHVDHAQKGWVQALPHIHFAIMNTVNMSTRFSNFQLHLLSMFNPTDHTNWFTRYHLSCHFQCWICDCPDQHRHDGGSRQPPAVKKISRTLEIW